MKTFSFVTAVSVLAVCSPAMAANLAVITSPPTMLNAVVLALAIGCLVGSFRISSVVRGGMLAKPWQLFAISFVLLCLSQVSIVLRDMEVLTLPSFVYPALFAAAFGVLLYAIFETKKTLE